MPEQRMVIRPDEIEHIEVICGTCQNSTLIPIPVPPYDTRKDLFGLKTFLQCPWCDERIDTIPGLQTLMKNLCEYLETLRQDLSFTVRFIVKQ